MKKGLTITGIAGALLTAVGFVAPFIVVAYFNGSGGHLGGVEDLDWLYWFFEWGDGYGLVAALLGISLLLTVLIIALARKSVSVACSKKSMGLLLGFVLTLSLFALGGFRLLLIYLIPELGGFSEFPVTVVFGLIAMVVGLLIGIALIHAYVKERRRIGKRIGILWDIVISLLYFLPFLLLISGLTQAL